MTRTTSKHEDVTEVLHIMAGHGWATADDGDVESPTGWFAYLYNDRNGRDDESLVDTFETDLDEHDVKVEDFRGGWVLYTDNYGFRARCTTSQSAMRGWCSSHCRPSTAHGSTRWGTT